MLDIVGLVLAPFLTAMDSNIRAFADGVIDAVEKLVPEVVLKPLVKFEADTAIYYHAAFIFQVNCNESPFTTLTAVKV